MLHMQTSWRLVPIEWKARLAALEEFHTLLSFTPEDLCFSLLGKDVQRFKHDLLIHPMPFYSVSIFTHKLIQASNIPCETVPSPSISS